MVIVLVLFNIIEFENDILFCFDDINGSLMIIVMFGGFLIESYIWSNNEIGLVIVNFVFGIYFVIIMVEDGCELVELV